MMAKNAGYLGVTFPQIDIFLNGILYTENIWPNTMCDIWQKLLDPWLQNAANRESIHSQWRWQEQSIIDQWFNNFHRYTKLIKATDQHVGRMEQRIIWMFWRLWLLFICLLLPMLRSWCNLWRRRDGIVLYWMYVILLFATMLAVHCDWSIATKEGHWRKLHGWYLCILLLRTVSINQRIERSQRNINMDFYTETNSNSSIFFTICLCLWIQYFVCWIIN